MPPATDRDPGPTIRPKRRFGLRDLVTLVVLGLVVAVGTRLILAVFSAEPAAGGRPPPLLFSARVQNEENPLVADILALTELVTQRYAYLEHRHETDGLDLSALEEAALRDLGTSPTERAFRTAVRRYAAALSDGHGWVRFREHHLPGERHWPFTPMPVAEGVMVDGVHPDAAAILQRGDLVRAVNGQPIESLIESSGREVFASTPAARRRRAIRRASDWTTGTALRLTLDRPGTGTFEVEVECPLIRMEIPRPGALPTGREVRMLDDGIGYLRPGDFSPPADSAFREASPTAREEILAGSYAEIERIFAGFHRARALVLDLRGNPGGTDLLGRALVRHLLPAGFTYFSLSALHGDGWSRPMPMVCEDPEPEHRFGGTLVCLIDAGTFSVADNVAACLDDLHPQVTFVGSNTGGGSGAPRGFTLPRTGCEITFCTMRVYSPSGRLIEGRGVVPDVAVVRTRADALAGRDTVLLAALERLRR